MRVQHFPLAVSPYSQDHAETDFQKHSFCYFVFWVLFFSFFKYLYQHKSFLRMGYQLKLDTVKDKCGG